MFNRMLLLSMVFVSFGSSASFDSQSSTRCHSDSYGNTYCRGNNSYTISGRVATMGNEIWLDSQGNVTRGTDDAFGNSTYREINGLRILDEGLLPVQRSQSGRVMPYQGNKNSQSEKNRETTTRCSSDSFGYSRCN